MVIVLEVERSHTKNARQRVPQPFSDHILFVFVIQSFSDAVKPKFLPKRLREREFVKNSKQQTHNLCSLASEATLKTKANHWPIDQ